MHAPPPMDPHVAAAFARIDRPFAAFAPALLGDDFAAQLRTVSELWFGCGYRPGIGAYLAFFLLRDFIALHDERFPPRFASLQAMAKSFYETDLFIRAVTDSGREPSGGISSPAVREQLANIMARHQAVGIPDWMMTWFGWALFENVETACAPLTAEQQRLHLAYMTTTYRLMGVPFANDRARMTTFARAVERAHTAPAPQLERHARTILRIGEMIGVSSAKSTILPMLPTTARELFAPMADRVRPGWLRRVWLRVLGKLLVPQAVGKPRRAVPWHARKTTAPRPDPEWQAQQLQHTLQALAIPAPEQARVFGSHACATCELRTDFETWFRVFCGSESRGITEEQQRALTAVGEAIAALSPTAVTCWSSDALACPTWDAVRRTAGEALGRFGWPLEAPPAIDESE